MRQLPVFPARQAQVGATRFQPPLAARQIPQFPNNTMAVNPGGPRMYDGLSPPNIPDPQQRGIVTRYGLIDNVEIVNLVAAAFLTPAVIAFKTSYSITAGDWAALAAAIEASMTAAPQSQLFPFETQQRSTEGADTATMTGTFA